MTVGDSAPIEMWFTEDVWRHYPATPDRLIGEAGARADAIGAAVDRSDPRRVAERRGLCMPAERP